MQIFEEEEIGLDHEFYFFVFGWVFYKICDLPLCEVFLAALFHNALGIARPLRKHVWVPFDAFLLHLLLVAEHHAFAAEVCETRVEVQPVLVSHAVVLPARTDEGTTNKDRLRVRVREPIYASKLRLLVYQKLIIY